MHHNGVNPVNFALGDTNARHILLSVAPDGTAPSAIDNASGNSMLQFLEDSRAAFRLRGPDTASHNRGYALDVHIEGPGALIRTPVAHPLDAFSDHYPVTACVGLGALPPTHTVARASRSHVQWDRVTDAQMTAFKADIAGRLALLDATAPPRPTSRRPLA